MKNLQNRFPKEFLFGVATASLQIEGGDTNNSWFDWCEKGMVPNGDHCILANDHWNRIDEDISCMKDLNITSYRLSLEWSRIEPKKGKYDVEAINHYKLELEKLIQAGIEPMITLHHFSNPSWLEQQKAWTSKEVVTLFELYTSFVVKHLGHLCSHWVTINEPNVYLVMGYMEGDFPPGEKGNIRAFFKGAKNMIQAHKAGFKAIHRIRKEQGYDNTKVGAALHLRVFDTLKEGLLSTITKRLHYFLFQDLFFNGMLYGYWLIGLKSKRYFDFIGINYYTRDILKAGFVNFPLFAERLVKQGSEVNDLNWEIYPEGLLRIMKRYFHKCKLPIYITENGIADAKDEKRKTYLRDHLAVILDGIKDGIDIRGYYHWTLMDNFEWAEGYEARFGLFKHDLQTQERSLRSSGQYYANICKNKSLDV